MPRTSHVDRRSKRYAPRQYVSETHDHKPEVNGHAMLTMPKYHPLADIQQSYPSELRWYVFYTRIHGEKLAEAAIGDLGLEVYVPYERRRRRRDSCEVALFPRYGFVRFDINRDTWGQIRAARGVVDVLRQDGRPLRVPDSAVDGLRVADAAGVFDQTKPPSAGMEVEITQGPFAGMIGKVRRARSRERVEVLMKLLGSELSATVSVNYLRAVG